MGIHPGKNCIHAGFPSFSEQCMAVFWGRIFPAIVCVGEILWNLRGCILCFEVFGRKSFTRLSPMLRRCWRDVEPMLVEFMKTYVHIYVYVNIYIIYVTMYIHVLLLSYLYVCTKSGFHIYIENVILGCV